VELYEIGQLLADPHCRLLTITGPGGILGTAERNWLQDGEETVVEVERSGHLYNTYSRISAKLPLDMNQQLTYNSDTLQ
jgi:hypothetical protein